MYFDCSELPTYATGFYTKSGITFLVCNCIDYVFFCFFFICSLNRVFFYLNVYFFINICFAEKKNIFFINLSLVYSHINFVEIIIWYDMSYKFHWNTTLACYVKCNFKHARFLQFLNLFLAIDGDIKSLLATFSPLKMVKRWVHFKGL